MRFNTNYLAPIVGMSLIAGGSAATGRPCEPCPEEVVLQAAQEGFLQYVLANCIPTTNDGPENMMGEEVLNGSICLSSWIANHQSGSPIPKSGDCRDSYQAFIDSARDDWDGGIASYCPYDSRTGLVDFNDDCGENVIDVGYGGTPVRYQLDVFREMAGFYIGGVQCPGVTVRTLSNKDAYSVLVAAAYAAASPAKDDPVSTQLIEPEVDGGTGLCYTCYHNFHFFLQAGKSAAEDRGTVAACEEDVFSQGCIESTDIMNALEEFKLCSGGFDLIFQGPVCKQGDIDDIQQLIPAPYFTFAHCAYNPGDEFCTTIAAYISQIKAESDSSCVVCYQDFFNSVVQDAQDEANVIACTGSDGVWDTTCVAAESNSLFDFQACSGFKLSTVKTTHVAPTVTSTTRAPVTTEATTEAPVETTAEVTTSKSAATAAASVVVAALAVMLL